MLTPNQLQLPIQPVNEPILCSPYEEPTAHWVYDTTTGAASQNALIPNCWPKQKVMPHTRVDTLQLQRYATSSRQWVNPVSPVSKCAVWSRCRC